MRAVLAGCGGMSKAWLEAARDLGVQVVGLVDLDLSRADARRAEFGLDAVTGVDLDAVLKATQPDLLFDVVVPEARHAAVSSGLAHGCSVLSEKPMANTLEEARDLVALAERTGKIHAVIQNRRYLPTVRRIARFLKSGQLGLVDSVHCDFFLGPHFGGFREEMDHVLLLDMAIHTFDMGRLMGGQDPSGVFAREWNPIGSWYAHGAAAVAVFDLPSGGCLTYRGSWASEGLNTSWEASWRFACEKGTLVWDGSGEPLVQRRAGDDGFIRPQEDLAIPPLDPADRVEGHLGVMADFLDSLGSGKPPETVGSQNIKSLAMVFGAIESAKARSWIPLSE